ncbi:MAG TPA: metal-dependent hydrolase, partial [Balneolales bacterium]|nr:metal-dependent hydrolase [Balneolales bacterium]
MSKSIKAFWLGHSTFRFVSPDGHIIYVDPFLTDNPKTPDNEKNPDKIDFILLTHGHEVHVGDTLDLAKKTGAKVVGILELITVLQKNGLKEDQSIGMNKGGTVYFDDFKVTMTSANHSSSWGGVYTGEPAGLMIRFNNGYTVYHAGDTNIMYDMKIYGEIYKPNLVCLPIGDHFTMDPTEAAYAAKLVNAKFAVPIHYGTWPPLIGSPEE